jgi:hypothetical protein
MGKQKAKWIYKDSNFFNTGSSVELSLNSGSVLPLTSSVALTASYALNVGAEAYISASGQNVVLGEVVAGKITADEFHTTITSASIIYASGSSQFGDTLDDTHVFSGSVTVVGGLEATSLTGSIDWSNITNINSGSMEEFVVDTFLLNATHISNEYVELSQTPTDASNVIFDVQTAGAQIEGVDYALTQSNKVTWKSPYTLSASIAEGDRVRVLYTVAGNAVVEGTTATASYVEFTDVANRPSGLISSSLQVNYDLIQNQPVGFVVTASGALTNETASFALTASYVDYENVVNKPTLVSGSSQLSSDISGSFVAASSSIANEINSLQSFSSSIDNIYISASGQNATLGDVTVNNLYANEIHTTLESASIIYSSGSTKFGDTTDDTHEFTGSISIRSGSFLFNSDFVDHDFIINKSGSGSVYTYDAGNDTHTFSGSAFTYNGDPYLTSTDVYISSSGQNVTLGNITADKITANEIHTTLESASIIYSSGSTKFGDTIDDVHSFTGSIKATESSIQALNITASTDWSNVDNVPDFVLESETGSMTVATASVAENVYLSASLQNADLGNTTITGSLFVDNYIRIQATTDGEIPHQEGVLFYDEDDNTLAYYNDSPDVKVNVGQELMFKAVNKTGETLLNGTVVHISGSQGNRPGIAKADADFDETSHDTLGVVTHDILNNQEGYVTTFGLVRDVNTATFSEGDILYLSGSAGEFTNVIPVWPEVQHKVRVGYVVSSHATQGIILTSIEERQSLDEIQSVKITTPQQNEVLVFSGSYGWYNSPTAPSASYVDYTNVVNKPTLVSGSSQLSSDISGSFVEASSSIATDINNVQSSITTYSSSASSRISDLENFSSSLDNIYISASGQTVVLGNITADTIFANEIHTTLESASIIYSSGSTKFGDTQDDVHSFTGSLRTSGSVNITGSAILNGYSFYPVTVNFGRSGTTDTGSYYRGTNGRSYSDTIGYHAPTAGIIKTVTYTRSDTDLSVFEVTANGTTIGSLTSTALKGAITLSSSFSAGDVIGFRNSSLTGNATNQVMGFVTILHEV